MSLHPGEPVPGTPYQIVRWLGEGGMGVVYEAVHRDVERRVAIKLLHPHLCGNARALDRFRAEARASSRIGSAVLADIYDFEVLDDGRLMFAMEYLEGHTLAVELDRAPLPPARLLAVFRQLCKGLHAAHRADVVHRDVKPENVMLVDLDGRADAVKLLDFGVAHTRDLGDDGSGVGTPGYCPPEQIVEGRVSAAADIYALGVTMYEAACGVPPFESRDDEELLRAHVEDAPQPPHLRNEIVPEAIGRVILRCLAKDPAHRFEDMIELETALCEAQIQVGIATVWDRHLALPGVDSPRRDALARRMPQLQRPPRRRRAAWAAAFGGVLLVGATSAEVLRDSPADAGSATAVQDDEVAPRIEGARTAAAKAAFVYPPVDQPTLRTSLQWVHEIQGLDPIAWPSAATAAAELRQEFAATLVRLGNRYWSAEAARPFARDFYVQALTFAPDDPTARERAGVGPAEAMMFARRALLGDFTLAELIAVEPMGVLATHGAVDPEVLREVADRRASDMPRGASERLDRLIGELGPGGTLAPTAALPASSAVPNPTEPETEIEPELETETQPELETETQPEPKRPASNDPVTEAASVAARGDKARRSGDRTRASNLYHRALDLDGGCIGALRGLGELAFSKALYADAIPWFERASKRRRRSSRDRIRLGDAYFKVGRYKDARREYTRADELGDRSAAARMAKIDDKLGAAP